MGSKLMRRLGRRDHAVTFCDGCARVCDAVCRIDAIRTPTLEQFLLRGMQVA